MERNSKIYIGLAVFLFCGAFLFKFIFGNGTTVEFIWADMVTLMMGFLAAAVAMIILTQKAKKEESFDDEELELKEFSKRSMPKHDGDEFV